MEALCGGRIPINEVTVTDVTRDAGVDDPRWSGSAALLDYDRDGDLALFVTNYLNFTRN